MMNEIKLFPIGRIENNETSVRVVLDPKYAEGLSGLEEFSHVKLIWWEGGCDNETDRSVLTEERPYKKGPERLGVFALRSPERPNPIAVSNADIAYVDVENGIVGIRFTDAFDGTPLLDLKPCTPSIDTVEDFRAPSWCAHWPKSCEESADFAWDVIREDDYLAIEHLTALTGDHPEYIGWVPLSRVLLQKP